MGNVKAGRNDPCPCGSGKKYKKCCLLKEEGMRYHTVPPEVFAKAMEVMHDKQRQAIEWERQYGEVRPIIHTDFKGKKVVAIGSRISFADKSRWKTFPDFLVSYLAGLVGKEWGRAELAKPLEERHQIMKWYDGMQKFKAKQTPDQDGIFSAVPNGAFSAYILLAYDLYTLEHHTALQKKLIERLKIPEQFQGARYEIFATATSIRAGFKIDFEDESDPTTKHPEFVGTHIETKQKISVEAKSRHRPGVLGFPGEEKPKEEVKAGIGRLFKDALEKPAKYPYVVFIDLNLPPYEGKVFDKPWFVEVRDTISKIGGDVTKTPDRFNLVVVTNHPHHYGRDEEHDPAKDVLCIYSPRPIIKAKYPQTIFSIFDAAMKYGRVPNSFPKGFQVG